jgi:hypothetical protein
MRRALLLLPRVPYRYLAQWELHVAEVRLQIVRRDNWLENVSGCVCTVCPGDNMFRTWYQPSLSALTFLPSTLFSISRVNLIYSALIATESS